MEIIGIEPHYFDSNLLSIPINLIFKSLSGDQIISITLLFAKSNSQIYFSKTQFYFSLYKK